MEIQIEAKHVEALRQVRHNSSSLPSSAKLSSSSSVGRHREIRDAANQVLAFKIALCQITVTPDKERNIAHARSKIQEAAAKGAKLVLLPEIWNSPYSNDCFPVYAEDIDAGGDASPSTAMLSQLSRNLNITIVGGSIPERSGDQLFNTCCVFGTDGNLKAKHRKIHLFDIDIPGKITFMESNTLTAGETPTIVDTEVGRIGIGICYDIQFQELAMIYAARARDYRNDVKNLRYEPAITDWWIGDNTLKDLYPELYVCSTVKDACISEVLWILEGGIVRVWNLRFYRALEDWELAASYSLFQLIQTCIPRGFWYSLGYAKFGGRFVILLASVAWEA
uniref:CN hydrolase domain-containing protein n=1 Tax=Quercus lobata TaxID=97700 RepID=A0A7N2LX35_QUELO